MPAPNVCFGPRVRSVAKCRRLSRSIARVLQGSALASLDRSPPRATGILPPPPLRRRYATARLLRGPPVFSLRRRLPPSTTHLLRAPPVLPPPPLLHRRSHPRGLSVFVGLYTQEILFPPKWHYVYLEAQKHPVGQGSLLQAPLDG